jgi:4-aminobutyrate aminotransferase-like enzyme
VSPHCAELAQPGGFAGRVSAACLRRRMLLLPCGIRQAVRFAPPLVLSEAEAARCLEIFGARGY